MRRFWNWFSSLSKSYQIAFSVLVVHGALLLFGWTDYLFTLKTQRKQAMIVRAVIIPQSTQKQSLVPSLNKIKTPSKKKETLSLKKNHLLEEVQRSLEAFHPAPKNKASATELSIPSLIKCKTEIRNESTSSRSYAENLVELLTNSLDLPEFGSVKLAISIDSSGSVIDCKVLEEKSHKNSEFLRNRLHELTFPCFNDFGLSDNRLEFTVTFNNLR